jgi:hypothetical protein
MFLKIGVLFVALHRSKVAHYDRNNKKRRLLSQNEDNVTVIPPAHACDLTKSA